MSGQQLGTAVGFVAGFFLPGGPQVWAAIGGMIGGYVDPTQIQGPRLQDARAQTSRDGVPIPWGYGTFPCAGNVIWQGPLVERKNTDDGKGSGTEITNYTYTRSYAIAICEGPITGILQVKRNGKIVYDVRPGYELEEEFIERDGGLTGDMIASAINNIMAGTSKFLLKATFYLGDEAQMPDPTIEAHEGADNVEAHRGIAYMVMEDDDVTELAGAIPQYEFIVSSVGTIAPAVCQPLAAVFAATEDGDSDTVYVSDGETWGDTVNSGVSGSETSMLWVGGGKVFSLINGTSKVSHDFGATWETVVGLEAAAPRGMTYTGSAYLVFYHYGSFASRSGDGVNFTPVAVEDRTYYGAESRGPVVIVASTLGMVLRSGDGGETFELIPAPGGGVSNTHVAVSSTGFVVARGVNAYCSPSGLDGTWAGSSLAFSSQVAGLAFGVIDNVALFVAISEAGETARSLDNGYTWSYGDGLPMDMGAGNTQNLCFSIDRFIAVGGSPQVHATFNGLNWSSVWDPGHTGISLDWVGSLDAFPNGAVRIPDVPGSWLLPDGTIYAECTVPTIARDQVVLGTIVADLCQREGLTADDYDVSQLTDLVDGFRIANEGGADAMISPLMTAYFFDVGEWDGKLRFVKRGGESVLSLGMDDLAERDGDAIEQERVQEAELLRRVTVGYLDPAAAYTATTQKWERRAGTVQARGEASVEVPVVMPADTAAQVAHKRGKVAWSETERFKISLPYRRSALTPTDVVTLTDAKGKVHRIRLMGDEEDSGVKYIDAMLDSQSAYTSTVTGVSPKPPTFVDPGVIGPTFLHVMDLPIWSSDSDDELGVYIAASGVLGGWRGAQIQVSTDGGATYAVASEVTGGATIGYTTTALPAWAGSEYPSQQSVTVYLPDPPASVDYATLLRYANRAAIKNDSGVWEVLQYETVVDNGSNSYTLSGLVRGRYNTAPGAAASGADFVLLNSSVIFLRAEQWMYGQTLTLKAVSYGTSPDDNIATTFAFTLGASQIEWPAHNVTASRDGGDNVTATWIGRGRLGPETSPHHGKYFAGYRVTFDDGTTETSFDTTALTYTLASAADPITVTVAPINSITGAGPASTGIIV